MLPRSPRSTLFPYTTLFRSSVCEVVHVRNLAIYFIRPLADGQKALVGVEGEMLTLVVGEVPGMVAVADDKQLQEAQQRVGVAAAGLIAIINDLLHGPARVDAQGLELDLHQRQAVDEQNHVIAMEIGRASW